MTRLPIDLSLKTMTAKVSVGAHARLRHLSEKHHAKMQDVLSACLLHMEEDKLVEILDAQEAAWDALPRSVQIMLRNVDKLSDDEKKLLKDILG